MNKKTNEAPFAVPVWPANTVETWPLDKIKPYEKNPRSHPQAQVDLLAKLMQRYGIDQPIVVDEGGVILKGHGRRLAALSAGFEVFPVVVHQGLSDDDKRAIRLADNQVALLSGWDEEILRDEMTELRARGFDLSMTGFADGDLSSIFEEIEAETKPDRALTTDEQAVLNKAWRILIKEWQAHAARYEKLGFFSTNFTRGALQVYFMRALLYGSDIPRAATTAYNGHRIFQAGSHGKPYLQLLEFALERDVVLHSLQWFCGGKPTLDQMLGVTLGIQDHRPPADFPPLLARDLIDEYTPHGGSVLDPCHGWGGRLLGFMLSDAESYQGFDTDAATVKGCTEMFNDLSALRPGKKAALTCSPFEDAAPKDGAFDFALTSPPYYDTEQYGGDLSSWKRYSTFDLWVDGFFKPLICKTAAALKPGGTFALQIGNQSYPLEAAARKIIQYGGLEFVEKRTTDMVNNYMGTDPQEKGEIILILRKPGDAKLSKYGEAL